MEERESLSRCLCDGVIVARPGQVQVPLGFKVNPGEPEAAEALLRSPIDGWVGPRLLRLFSWHKDVRAQQ